MKCLSSYRELTSNSAQNPYVGTGVGDDDAQKSYEIIGFGNDDAQNLDCTTEVVTRQARALREEALRNLEARKEKAFRSNYMS